MKNNIIFIMTNHTYFSLTIAFLNSVKRNWPLHPKILCHYTDLSETELEKLSSYSNSHNPGERNRTSYAHE